MDFLRIAARAATTAEICPIDQGPMLYDDGRSVYACVLCNHSKSPSTIAILAARRVAQQPNESEEETESGEVLEHPGSFAPATEFACRVEIDLHASFEGTCSKTELLKKFKQDLMAALETAVSTTSRDMKLHPGEVLVNPISVECVVNDMLGSTDED